MTTEIEVVPCLSDNYAYLVKSGDQCAVVDPSEAAPVQEPWRRRAGSSPISSTPIIIWTIAAAIWT